MFSEFKIYNDAISPPYDPPTHYICYTYFNFESCRSPSFFLYHIILFIVFPLVPTYLFVEQLRKRIAKQPAPLLRFYMCAAMQIVSVMCRFCPLSSDKTIIVSNIGIIFGIVAAIFVINESLQLVKAYHMPIAPFIFILDIVSKIAVILFSILAIINYFIYEIEILAIIVEEYFLPFYPLCVDYLLAFSIAQSVFMNTKYFELVPLWYSFIMAICGFIHALLFFVEIIDMIYYIFAQGGPTLYPWTIWLHHDHTGRQFLYTILRRYIPLSFDPIRTLNLVICVTSLNYFASTIDAQDEHESSTIAAQLIFGDDEFDSIR